MKDVIVLILFIILTLFMSFLIRKYIRGNYITISYIRLALCYSPVVIPIIYYNNFYSKKLSFSFNYYDILLIIFIGTAISLFNYKDVKTLLNKDMVYLMPKITIHQFNIMFFSVILATVYEEILFRYFVWKLDFDLLPSVMISSLCFVAFHYANSYSRKTMDMKKNLLLIILSIFMYLSIYMTGNIIYPIIGHLMYNFFTLIFMVRRLIVSTK